MSITFRWSSTNEDATIFIEGNDKYVPAEFQFQDTTDNLKNRQQITRHYHSYKWQNWIEDAVSIGIIGVSDEMKRNIAEGKDEWDEDGDEEKNKELLKDPDMIISYDDINEVIKSNCICYDHSGNTYDFDEETIEWLQTQIKKLRNIASTNISIAKMRWEQQMVELTKTP